MAEASQPSQAGEGTGGPPVITPGTPLPNWLMNPDEIGYQTVLVMQVRKETETEIETETELEEPTNKKQKITPLPSPFIIGASVELLIGQQKARKVVASKENRGTRYLLRTNSHSVAKKLLTLTELTNGTPVEVFVHPNLNSVQGIVYDPDSINDKEKDIMNYLKSQGVINVRRICKRVQGELQNTPLLVLTFKGAVLPEFVFFGLLRVKIRTYYPSPLICYNCGVYGHPKKFCNQLSVCLRCSQQLHVSGKEQCQNRAFCMHCKANHPITSRDCPRYQQEVKIVQHKTDNRVSFGEARRVFRENAKDTYASALQQRLTQVELEKDSIINTLRKELETVKAELELLKELTQTNKPPSNNDTRANSAQVCVTQGNSAPSASVNGNDSQTKQSSTNTNTNQNNGRKSRKDQSSTSPHNNKRPPMTTRSAASLRVPEQRSRSRSEKRTNTSPIRNNSKGKRRHLLAEESKTHPK